MAKFVYARVGAGPFPAGENVKLVLYVRNGVDQPNQRTEVVFQGNASNFAANARKGDLVRVRLEDERTKIVGYTVDRKPIKAPVANGTFYNLESPARPARDERGRFVSRS